MPWQVEDVERINADLNDTEKKMWVEVANETLEREIENGKKAEDAEAIAIRVANAAVARAKESRPSHSEGVSLAEKLMDAFYEGATVKTAVQGLLKAAQGVSRHPNVPKAVKDHLASLRTMLKKTWEDLAEEETPAPEAVTTEARRHFREVALRAGQSVQEFTQALERAARKAVALQDNQWLYVSDVYDDLLVYNVNGAGVDAYYEAPYTVTSAGVVEVDASKAVEVIHQTLYRPKMREAAPAGQFTFHEEGSLVAASFEESGAIVPR